MFKKLLKYSLRTFLCIILITVGYLLLALILSVISTSPEKLTCEKDKSVFVTTNGVHLDIIIPEEDLNKEFKQALQIEEYVRYVAFGWGDKGFYLETPTWGDLKFSTAVYAMFLKSETAMHVTKYPSKQNRWIKIEVCEEQLEAMKVYIKDSFERDDNGNIIEIKDSGYFTYDTFYEAYGSYNCIQTCNSWVNQGLKKGKIKTSLWSPFDKGVLYHIN